MVASDCRNARAISAVVSPPSELERQRRARLGGQQRMAGDEDQPQQIIADLVIGLRFQVLPSLAR